MRPRWRFGAGLLVLMLLLYFTLPNVAFMSDQERHELQQEVKGMFYHAYDSYMLHAFPKDELLPLSCNGSETLGSYSLTLVDSLDALLILGNHSEFEKAITWVGDNLDFDLDANVSVFETNIRVLGGLLSAHLLAADAPDLFPDYNGRLLELAVDLASRLLPAFQTHTRIPYGTVNLRHGVPEGETTVASLAGAGTLILEFGLLSRITGDPAFEEAAHAALVGLWERRSAIGLYGGHIDTQDGTWTDASSGIGAGADSFFEYLLKGAILLDEADYYVMFEEAYEAILAYLVHNGWYFVVEMNSGKMVLPYFDALSAFWPGLQVLLGDVSGAIQSVTGFAKVWAFFGFTPEKANLINGALLEGQKSYPLRPELVESLYYLHQATGDPIWLHFGKGILSALQNRTRVACGYAGVVDVETGELEDHMNSFFLAETLKYLYLLFDDGSNFVHSGARGRRYLFNTEGHVLPVRRQFFAPANRSLGVINGHRHCQRPHFTQALAVPWLNLASSSAGLPAARPPAPEAATATENEAELTNAEAVVEAGGGQSAAPQPAGAATTTTPVLTGAQMLEQLMEQSKEQRLRVEQQMAEMRGLIDQLEAKLKLEADLDAATAAAADATPSPPAPDTAPASPRAADFKRSQEFQRMKDIARMIEQRREKQQQQKLLQEQHQQTKQDELFPNAAAAAAAATATATATTATSAVPHSRVQVVEVRLPTMQHHHQQGAAGQPWVAEDGSPLINRVKSCDPSPAAETATIATATKPTTADQTTDDGADADTDDVTGGTSAAQAGEAPREVVFQLLSDGRLVAVGQHAALDPETMAHLLHYAQAQLQGGLNPGSGPGHLGRWLDNEQQPPPEHDQTTNNDEAVAREAVVSPVR